MANAPESLSTFASLIDWQGEKRGSSVAWQRWNGDSFDPLSWKVMADGVEALALQMKSIGIRKGTVLSQLSNECHWIVLDAACSKLGWTHAPVDFKKPFGALAADIDWIEPVLIVLENDSSLPPNDSLPAPLFFLSSSCWSLTPATRGSNRAAIPSTVLETSETTDRKSLRAQTDSDLAIDSSANLLLTSGSTGRSKGVLLSHRNLLSNAYAKLDAMPQNEHDLRLNILPFAHAYARTCEVTTWAISGGCMACAPSLDLFWRFLIELHPTLVNAVPSIYHEAMKRMISFRDAGSDQHDAIRKVFGNNIRRIASGGAGLPLGTSRYFFNIGLPIFQGYGLTETSPVVCSHREQVSSDESPWRRLYSDDPQSVGPPVRGVRIRVESDGRLYVKGPNVFQRYWKDQRSTEEKKDPQGWLDTGDFVEQLSNGSLRILGRADDCIVLSTGRKVHPFPIEKRILEEPSISQCCLIGQNRSHLILLLVPQSSFLEGDAPTFSEQEWLHRVRSQLLGRPSYEIPKRVVILSQPFSQSNGMATAKGTLCREKIAQTYETVFERLEMTGLQSQSNALQ